MRKLYLFVLTTSIILLGAASVFAQGEPAAAGGHTTLINITGPFALAIAASFGALADGRAIAAACEATARNPSAGGRIFTALLLGMALIETLVLFTLLAVQQKWA